MWFCFAVGSAVFAGELRRVENRVYCFNMGGKNASFR